MNEHEIKSEEVRTETRMLDADPNAIAKEYDPTAWYAQININGATFQSGAEYVKYMTENRKWGPHPDHTMTEAEFAAYKAAKSQ